MVVPWITGPGYHLAFATWASAFHVMLYKEQYQILGHMPLSAHYDDFH